MFLLMYFSFGSSGSTHTDLLLCWENTNVEVERAHKYCSPQQSWVCCCASCVSRDNTKVLQRAVAHNWPGGIGYTQLYLGCFHAVDKCFQLSSHFLQDDSLNECSSYPAGATTGTKQWGFWKAKRFVVRVSCFVKLSCKGFWAQSWAYWFLMCWLKAYP